MADNYDRYDNEGSGGGFMMGLLTGTVLGAGLGMLLAPKAGSDLRGVIGEQARNLGNMANEQYRRASESAGGWADKGREFADKGREFVDKARDAVAKGTEEARGYAASTTGSTYGGNSGNSGGNSFGSGSSSGTGSSFGSGSAPGSDINRP